MFEVEILKKHWLRELHAKNQLAGTSASAANAKGDDEGAEETEASSPQGRHDQVGVIVEEDDFMQQLQYREGAHGDLFAEVDKRKSFEAELMLQLVLVCRHLGANERCAEELVTHSAPASMVELLTLASHVAVPPMLRLNAAALITPHLRIETEVLSFCKDSVKEAPKLMQIDGTIISPGAPKTRPRGEIKKKAETEGSALDSPEKAPKGLARFKAAALSTKKANRFADLFATAGAEQVSPSRQRPTPSRQSATLTFGACVCA